MPLSPGVPHGKVHGSGQALVTDLVALGTARVGTGCMGTGTALWSAGSQGHPDRVDLPSRTGRST